jgi:UbiA prenyltransferase family
MAADPILIISAPPALAREPPQGSTILVAVADYWALTKPEVNFLIVIATFTGFYLACPGPLRDFPWLRLVHTLLGTLLVASGTGTLNQYVERSFDAQMRRTARRPLAAGRLKPSAVLRFGSIVGYGLYLSCDRGQCACEFACASYDVVLLVPLHTAQTTNTCVCPGRRASGCRASIDRLGGSIWQVEHRGMGTLRDAFSVAVPTLHGNCVEVPRRLCSRGLSDVAPRPYKS